MALVGRCPALFSFSPEALGATLAAIAELTGLQVVQVSQLVWADPELLLNPDRLKANMRGVAQALGVRLSEVAHMGAREPSVLALDGGRVEERLAALQRMLDLQTGGYEELVAAVLRNPGALLVPEPATLDAQLQALESALDAVLGEEGEEAGDEGANSCCCCCGDDPPGGGGSAAGGAAGGGRRAGAAGATTPVAVEVVETASGGPQPPQQQQQQPPQQPLRRSRVSLRRRVSALVLSKPSLLATPPQLLAGRVVHLALKAGVPPGRVLSAAISGPDLLAAHSCYIDRHCTALAAALSHAGGCAGGDAEAAALLVSEPSLLGQSVGSLSAKWLLAAAVFRSCEGWERRLARAGVSERAELLAAPHAAVLRLRFLLDRGLQGEVDPMEALRMSDALFHIAYPEFRVWQKS